MKAVGPGFAKELDRQACAVTNVGHRYFRFTVEPKIAVALVLGSLLAVIQYCVPIP